MGGVFSSAQAPPSYIHTYIHKYINALEIAARAAPEGLSALPSPRNHCSCCSGRFQRSKIAAQKAPVLQNHCSSCSGGRKPNRELIAISITMQPWASASTNNKKHYLIIHTSLCIYIYIYNYIYQPSTKPQTQIG